LEQQEPLSGTQFASGATPELLVLYVLVHSGGWETNLGVVQ